MKFRQTLERIPGGMMAVPLVLGALVNTLDQAHLAPVEAAMKALGVPPTVAGHYGLLQMVTTLLCPVAVIFWSRWQARGGIDSRSEPDDPGPATQPASP